LIHVNTLTTVPESGGCNAGDAIGAA